MRYHYRQLAISSKYTTYICYLILIVTKLRIDRSKWLSYLLPIYSTGNFRTFVSINTRISSIRSNVSIFQQFEIRIIIRRHNFQRCDILWWAHTQCMYCMYKIKLRTNANCINKIRYVFHVRLIFSRYVFVTKNTLFGYFQYFNLSSRYIAINLNSWIFSPLGKNF